MDKRYARALVVLCAVQSSIALEASRVNLPPIFDRKGWTLIVEDVQNPDPDSTTVVGTIQQLPGSEVILSTVGKSTVGTISQQTCPNDHCAIVEYEAGVDETFFEVRPEAFDSDGSPFPAKRGEPGAQCEDDGTEITALVYYTSTVNERIGENEARAWIRYGEVTTNVAFKQSGVPTKLRVVGILPFEYSEEYSSTLEMLKAFKANVDVQSERDRRAADVVFLIVSDGDECGRAHLMPADPAEYPNHQGSAYAVVRWSCMGCNWSFTHELGHLFGACHEEAAGDCSSSGGYNHAHSARAATPPWMTVNGKRDLCNDCARLNQWSTPNAGITCNGGFLGSTNANNTKQVMATLKAVAQLRCTR